MRPVAVGRPGTLVVPDGWAAGHMVPVAGTRTAMVAIRRPGGVQGPFDPDTGTYPTTPHTPHWQGSARVQVLSDEEQQLLTAEETVPVVGYLVAVDVAAPVGGDIGIQAGDLVRVVNPGPNGDPGLVGRDLTVRSMRHGSLVWEQDLHAVDYL